MNSKEIIEKEEAIVEAITQDKLTLSSTSSIQPAILLRLGLFVPLNRTKTLVKETSIDVSKEFSKIQFARSEGYDQITIKGNRLNVALDFQVWMGIVTAFSKFSAYSIDKKKIKLPFLEFAKMCNFSPFDFNKRLRTRVFHSLERIGSNTVSFYQNGTEKKFFTHLLKEAAFDDSDDSVTLEADDRLWELYQIDHRILVRKSHYFKLKGREVAQTIYLYISSLPDNFAPISFSRIRTRLNLLSEVKEQNRLIKQALERLKDIGYIDYSLQRKNRENYLIVHNRHKKCIEKIDFSELDNL